MPPNPPNSRICSVFLALAAAGPLQFDLLEPPVTLTSIRAPLFLLMKFGQNSLFCLFSSCKFFNGFPSSVNVLGLRPDMMTEMMFWTVQTCLHEKATENEPSLKELDFRSRRIHVRVVKCQQFIRTFNGFIPEFILI